LQASFYRVLSAKSSVFCCSSCSSVDSPVGFFSLARARIHSKLRSCFRLCRAGCVSSSSLRRIVRSLSLFWLSPPGAIQLFQRCGLVCTQSPVAALPPSSCVPGCSSAWLFSPAFGFPQHQTLPARRSPRCRAGFLLCLALFGFAFSLTVCIGRSNETRFLVTLVFQFCVGSLQGEAGIAFESLDQKTRGFVVQIALPWWFSKRDYQVLGEMTVRI
jgi:hypothetical protein